MLQKKLINCLTSSCLKNILLTSDIIICTIMQHKIYILN